MSKKDKRITRTVDFSDARYADEMTAYNLGGDVAVTATSKNYSTRINDLAKLHKVQIRKWDENSEKFTARGLPKNMTSFLNVVWGNNGGWTSKQTKQTGRKGKK